MTILLSIGLVKTYPVFFPLVDALRSFRVSRGGGGAHSAPRGRAKVAQTPGRERVNINSKNGDVYKLQAEICRGMHFPPDMTLVMTS